MKYHLAETSTVQESLHVGIVTLNSPSVHADGIEKTNAKDFWTEDTSRCHSVQLGEIRFGGTPVTWLLSLKVWATRARIWAELVLTVLVTHIVVW
jgi:hypothetical protein